MYNIILIVFIFMNNNIIVIVISIFLLLPKGWEMSISDWYFYFSIIIFRVTSLISVLYGYMYVDGSNNKYLEVVK